LDVVSPPVGLYKKLLEVAKSIPFIEKQGRNDHHHYDYVQAVDVVNRVRKELLTRGIIVLPGASDATHLQFDGKKHLTTVDLSYAFVDVETGEKVVVPWVGVGVDTGGDKGIYKAYTGGLKYALTTLFLVPTSDDPERDHLTDSEYGAAVDAALEGQGGHKDDMRPAAPTIPRDRAASILSLAQRAGHATIDMDAAPGTPPEFSPALKAKLALHDVAKLGMLNADTAEDVEAWLQNEVAQMATGTVAR
jgi:hypothetical protein